MTAATLLTGRLLSLSCRSAESRGRVHGFAFAGVGLGLLVAFTDYRDAVVERDALEQSATMIRNEPGGDRPVWFAGHWGFHYYGEKAGARAIYPGETVFEPGDWIIYPDNILRPYGQHIRLEPEDAERRFDLEIFDSWPLRTNPEFYDGSQPIRRHDGFRLRITIFRVVRRFTAEPYPGP